MKGKQFTTDDAPRRIRNTERGTTWAEAQTEKYRIVAHDPDAPAERQAIVAEELEARALARLSSKARRIAAAMLRYSPEVRREILQAFHDSGELVLPFEFVADAFTDSS